MKPDRTASGGLDPSSIPGEFRQNYRFLSELINCEGKNSSLAKPLEELLQRRRGSKEATLNRRQAKILRDCMELMEDNDPEPVSPPVPAELEASIRIKRRSSWLPWEAEAIRKIETWREDLLSIAQYFGSALALTGVPRRAGRRSKKEAC